MYKWHQAKILRAKGASIKKIAKKLKLSKNTVRKYLRSLSPPKFKARDYKKKIDKYNARDHSMLKESPDKRFLREKEHLKEIPPVEPILLYDREIRKVSNDGYISYNGGLYPVPMRLCLNKVMVESVFGKIFRVYDEKGLVAIEHQVNLFGKGIRPEHPEHEEVNKKYREKKEAYKSETANRFIEIFEDNGNLYIEGLRQRVGANLYWHLIEIMKYTLVYPVEEVSSVLRDCKNLLYQWQ